jgi:hypothetical protein
MAPSLPPADGIGEPFSPSLAPDLPRANVINLTVDSDEDQISEILHTGIVQATDFVTTKPEEPKEPTGILDTISETERDAERDAFGSIETGGSSASAVAQTLLQVNPEATPEETTLASDVNSANPSAKASVLENNAIAFIPPRPTAIQLSREEYIARDKELEALLREGVISFYASQEQNPPSTAPQKSNDKNSPSTHTSPPSPISDQSTDAAAAARFQKLKKQYEVRKRRADTTFSEDIEYEKACQEEEARLRLREKKQMYAEREAQGAADDERLFFSDIEPSPANGPSDFPAISPDSDREAPASKRPKVNRPNKIPTLALQESMSVGFEAENSRRKKSAKNRHQNKDRTKKVSRDRVQKSKNKKNKDKATNKRGRSRRGPEIANIDSLIGHNLIADAQANQGKPGAPGFTSSRRKDALKELIASMPTDQQKLYTADKTAIDKACRSFSGQQSIKAKGSSGWQLKGMRSSLEHYQLLGTYVASHWDWRRCHMTEIC